jgi:hypothetical protein
MKASEKEQIVREGTFLYRGERLCRVRIVRVGFRPGSGDDGDPEEWREDQHGRFYRIDYTPPRSDRFGAGGGYQPTLKAAVQAVEGSVAGVEWQV